MNIKCFLLVPTERTDELKREDGSVYGWAPIYRRDDTGEEMLLRNAPIGAIYRATWMESCKEYTGPDGQSWVVKTPGGEWHIDGRASNCTRREDDIHKCWCRHGDAPNFTVNKVGNTCSAGAGSIMMGSYHGFLINGELTSC